MSHPRPKIPDAPGLTWKPRKSGWEARWQCRSDLAKRGYAVKTLSIWKGSVPTETEAAAIAGQCRNLQANMLAWGASSKRQDRGIETPGRGEGSRWLFAHRQYDGEDCLIWPFYRDPHEGYGILGHKGEIWKAHRLMCQIVKGPAPSPKYQAAHNCGNGHLGCVNPKHLQWKTNSENQSDRREHGTQAGAKGNRTRFSADQVAEIRRLKGIVPQHDLAKRFGCKRGTIEYWQRSTHEPAPPGTSRGAIRRRNRPLDSQNIT